MYPGFLKQIKKQKDQYAQVAKLSMTWAMGVEVHHAAALKKALEALTMGNDIDINKFAALFAEIQQKKNEMASLLSAENVQEGTATLGGLKTFFIKDTYGYLVLAGEAFIHSPSIIPIMRFLSEKVKTNGIL